MARSKEMDLTTGNPFRSLLKFAIPVILGNLFQLFYTLADSVIVLLMDSQVALVFVWDRNAGQRMKKECARALRFPRF